MAPRQCRPVAYRGTDERGRRGPIERLMTDARHPERWLMDRRIQRLTAEHYRAFSMALMFAVSNRTDGYVTADDLEAIPHFKPESVEALVAAELWAPAEGGWIISDFLTTQTSRAQLEAAESARVKDAERKARERAAKKGTTVLQASTDWRPADSPGDNRPKLGNPADGPADGAGKAKDRPRTGKVLPAVPQQIVSSPAQSAQDQAWLNGEAAPVGVDPGKCASPHCGGRVTEFNQKRGVRECLDCLKRGAA